MKFSVIVPIYNVENYLVNCIESIIEQEFDTKKYEVLLVDDGSTDNSGDICDKYSCKFHHIKAIHKENGGLSDARNAGINASKAEYILFLDGDDTLCDKVLQICDELVYDQDILIGNQNRITKEGIEKKNFPTSVFDKNSALENVLEIFVEEYGIIPWAAYQSVYRTEVLKKNKLFFKKGLIGAEDCEFFFRYIKYVKSHLVTNYSLVNYLTVRPDSIMNNVKLDSVIGRLETFSKLFYQNESIQIRKFFSFKFCNTILDFSRLSLKKDQSLCEEYVVKNSIIIDYAKNKDRKYWIASVIWRIFGITRGSNIIINLLKIATLK